jgi:transcriptional regulator
LSADLDQALEIARRTKFSTLATYHDAEIVVVHIPVTLIERTSVHTQQDVKFHGHIMKTNPLYALLAAGDIDAKMTFLPANGYISPRIFSEKKVSEKVVPTWNYVAAHFDGSMHLEDKPESLRKILDV